ncbi:MAG: hypothetical protein KF819_29345 [Labilithrix sp.]|nr:hypothetical protein [Labilithrix sp.]
MRRLSVASLVIALAACVGSRVDSDPPATGPDGGSITAKACGPGNPCERGSCVDGFCCDAACDGVCEACNVPGKEGICSPVSGKPVHGACDGEAAGPCAGSCDGTQAKACAYPEVECGTGSCAGGTATLPQKCKAGACLAAETQTCSLGCFEEGCLGVQQVTGGYYFTCALLTDKRVRCWGDNSVGQVGQAPSGTPATDVYNAPTPVGSLSNVQMIASTFATACALLADGTVRCWGENLAGQLGNGTVDASTLPHHVPSAVLGVTGATFLAGSSAGHFCAIVAGGTLKCWGSNGAGQLGDGALGGNAPTPVTVCRRGSTGLPCMPSTGATFVAGGDKHTCAIFTGGQVSCWGGNDGGELGQPAPTGRLFPTDVPGLTATHLTLGNRLSCAASGGTAKCWGANGIGRLGNGTDATDGTTPTAVCTKQDCSTTLTAVTAVTTYDESSCAIAGGAVKCWGTNTGGQLGDGNASTSQNYAATTAIASGAVAVASGGGVNFAIVVDRANRDVRCWGNEGKSQCGTGGPSADRRTPVSPKW